MQRKRTFLYQINVTRDCNLRCTHCYIHSSVKKASGEMEGQSFRKLFAGIREHMEATGYDHAEIHVIGGEPTMLGPVFFAEHMPFVRDLLSGGGFSFEIILVSNLLAPQALEIARHFDRINTSWEPESRFPKPKLEQMWRDNLLTLQNDGINVGVTTAVTRPVVSMGARAILEHHYRHGIRQIHFGFFIPSGDGLDNRDAMFPEFIETSRFLIDAAEWYFEHRDADEALYVNPPESMLAAIDSGEPLDDIVCPIIAGSMDIDWDGKAATCLEAGGNAHAAWSGNALQTSVRDVAASDAFRNDVRKASRPKKECQACEEYPVCRSGCGVIFNYWNPETDEDCPGFKRFIKHMRAAHARGYRPRSEGRSGRVAF